jgi:hypothetical protein
MRRASDTAGQARAELFGHLRFAAQAAGKWCAQNTPHGKI